MRRFELLYGVKFDETWHIGVSVAPANTAFSHNVMWSNNICFDSVKGKTKGVIPHITNKKNQKTLAQTKTTVYTCISWHGFVAVFNNKHDTPGCVNKKRLHDTAII